MESQSQIWDYCPESGELGPRIVGWEDPYTKTCPAWRGPSVAACCRDWLSGTFPLMRID